MATATTARPSFSSKASSTIKTYSRTIITSIKSLDVQYGKPLADIKNKDTVLPIAIVSLLFCMWGLAYGLLDLMNFHIKVAMGIRREEAAILAAGYYGAYVPVPRLLAGPMIKRFGYRFTMIFGLLMLAFGDFMMSVGAQAYSLPGMVAAHFVVGVGVSTLERAANPYAVNCGPRSRATLRILVAQAWAGIGTVIAPFLANRFVFNAHSSSVAPPADPNHAGKCLMLDKPVHGDLTSVIDFYRGVGGCIVGLAVILAIVFFRTTWVPEVTEPTSPNSKCGWKLWKHPVCSLRYGRLWWGVVANFVNLGCQVTFAQFFMEHMKINACASDHWAAICMSFAQIAFVVGRFTAAGLVSKPRFFKPRYVLAFFIAGAIAFCAAGTVAISTTAISCAVMVMFFEAPSFPMIFESATADFAEWTATAETLMIMSISGGALQPALMGMLVTNVQISKAWWLTASCFCIVFSYTLANNVIPSFRKSVDAAELNQSTAVGDEEKNGVRSAASQDSTIISQSVVPKSAAPVATGGYFGGVGTS